MHDVTEDAVAYRDGVVVMALILSSFAMILLRERLPTRRHQLLAMTFIDCLVLINHVFNWLFNILAGMIAGAALFDNHCSAAAYMCLYVVGLSKSIYLYIMVEKLYIYSSQTHRLPRHKSKEYVIHVAVVAVGIVTMISWLFTGFGGMSIDKICFINWHRDALVYAICFIVVATIYMTARCTIVLLNTQNELTRQWAYKYIAASCINILCTGGNLINMAVCHNEMRLSNCLIACLLDNNITSASMHYLLRRAPAYKTMDDIGTHSGLALDLTGSEQGSPQSQYCGSHAEKSIGGFTHKSRGVMSMVSLPHISIVKKEIHPCAFVSGATGEGIHQYLAQIDEHSAEPTAKRPTSAIPRHVNFLPSHPKFEEHKGPKPNFSCFPNYSVETLSIHSGSEQDFSDIGSPQTGTINVLASDDLQRNQTALDPIRAELYSCDRSSMSMSIGSPRPEQPPIMSPPPTTEVRATEARPSLDKRKGPSKVTFSFDIRRTSR